jgi:hypothetical protein
MGFYTRQVLTVKRKSCKPFSGREKGKGRLNEAGPSQGNKRDERRITGTGS